MTPPPPSTSLSARAARAPPLRRIREGEEGANPCGRDTVQAQARCPAGRRTMAEREARIDRLLLGQEIADFLYRESELRDERRYREWLDLLAEDIRYWMPMRRNVKVGEDEREFTRADSDINWFDEGKDTLSRRVKQIETGIHWAEATRTRLSHPLAHL